MQPLEDRMDGSAGVHAENTGGDGETPGVDEDVAGDESHDCDDSDEEWIEWSMGSGDNVLDV